MAIACLLAFFLPNFLRVLLKVAPLCSSRMLALTTSLLVPLSRGILPPQASHVLEDVDAEEGTNCGKDYDDDCDAIDDVRKASYRWYQQYEPHENRNNYD